MWEYCNFLNLRESQGIRESVSQSVMIVRTRHVFTSKTRRCCPLVKYISDLTVEHIYTLPHSYNCKHTFMSV